jgi:hypothetical protein
MVIDERQQSEPLTANKLSELAVLLLQGPKSSQFGDAEVYSALAYFHDHHDTIVAAIEAGKSQAERARNSEPFSRDELLRRRAVTNGR